MEDGYLGRSIAAAGDVDGDGLADVLVGAPYLDDELPGQGVAFLIKGEMGLSGLNDPADAETIFVGSDEYDKLGSAVTGIGDNDGDGLDDVLVTADYVESPDGQSGAGAAYVFSGTTSGFVDETSASAVISGTREYMQFGTSAKGVGDIDNDGVDDILVGEPGWWDEGPRDPGTVYVFSGDLRGTLDTTDALMSIDDETLGAGTGESVASGDLNGDGLQDLVFGQPGSDDMGWYTGGVSVMLGGNGF
jgi:hypothetical protein